MLEIAVFENDEGGRRNFSTSMKKTYRVEKDGEITYPESKSFYHQELPLVAAALMATFNAIQDMKDEQTS